MANSITLPDELVEKWRTDYLGRGHAFIDVAKEITQWGADQELDKSNNWLVLNGYGEAASRLRAVRRPKPPSLKEQALKQLRDMDQAGALDCNTDKIRKALEALPND